MGFVGFEQTCTRNGQQVSCSKTEKTVGRKNDRTVGWWGMQNSLCVLAYPCKDLCELLEHIAGEGRGLVLADDDEPEHSLHEVLVLGVTRGVHAPKEARAHRHEKGRGVLGRQPGHHNRLKRLRSLLTIAHGEHALYGRRCVRVQDERIRGGEPRKERQGCSELLCWELGAESGDELDAGSLQVAVVEGNHCRLGVSCSSEQSSVNTRP
jgi:hypothetical protein